MVKKLLCVLLLTAVLLSVFPAMAEGGMTMKDLNGTDAFAIALDTVARLTPPNTLAYKNYHVQQGSATDGEYAYTILENQRESLCSIWKINMADWSVAETRYEMDLDHGNDMTYNSRLNQLIVVHNKPNYTHLSFIDPGTLEVVERREMKYRMYAIAYEEASDRYVIGISGSYDFLILDSEFNRLARINGKDTGLVKQGVDCDENYIYFPQCTSDSTTNVVMVYDWDGNFVTKIRVKAFQEIESMFHVDDEWYITFNASGSYIRRAKLEYDTLKK